jgi:hypothetical protein
MTETATIQDWRTWGTTDDDGHFLTLGEQAQRRRTQTVNLLATTLGETQPRVLDLMRDILRSIGTTASLGVLEETLEVERSGGMMIMNGERRRSPGGVFFKIVKQNYPETRRIFLRHGMSTKKAKGPAYTPKKKKEPKAKVERKPAVEKKEKGTTVKIQIFGRPTSRIVDQGTFVVMIFQTTALPMLPKGLPAPSDGKNNYIVSVSAKQWKQVVSALDDLEDSFIIEGFPQVDSKTGGIAVYATSITTKKMRSAKYASRESSTHE